jgi:hypothetical protein
MGSDARKSIPELLGDVDPLGTEDPGARTLNPWILKMTTHTWMTKPQQQLIFSDFETKTVEVLRA